MVGYKDYSKRIIFHIPAMKEFRHDYSFADIHVHSQYSHDCVTPLKSILKRAAALKIGIAITDHNRAEGAVEAAKQKKVMVIPAIEVTSREKKEILLYFYSAGDLKDFYEKYVKHRITLQKIPRTGIGRALRAVRSELPMREILDRAEEYNCLKAIPHPYNVVKSGSFFYARKKRAELFDRIQAVEVFNAAQRRTMNRRALKWAIRKNKGFIGGSDAHSLREVGNVVTACKAHNVEGFLECIRKNKNLVLGNETKLPSIMKITLQAMNDKRKNGWSKITSSQLKILRKDN